MEQIFQKKLKKILQGSFLRFDSFIVEKMGYAGEDDEKTRRQAFMEFRRRTDQRNIAAMPTMRRWFGIGDYHRPQREHVIEMCFALGLRPEEAEEYLTKGLAEPSFQVNDYQEILFLYGLENNLPYETCHKMMRIFEDSLDRDIAFSKTKTTRELRLSYELNKNLDREAFLLWMSDRADWFRGYSQTALNYMKSYRSAVLKGIREEAKERLLALLEETGYAEWSRRHPVKDEERKNSIRRFLKKTKKGKRQNVSEHLSENIRELADIAYDTKEANTRILAEVYAGDTSDRAYSGRMTGGIMRITGKYLSDLFNVPTQKEHLIRTMQALRELANMSGEEKCPQWIREIGEEYTRGRGDFSSAERASDTLSDYIREHRRRCHLIQRSDLLPMILHVAQRSYSEEHPGEYDPGEAREQFRNLADATLNACNMAAINSDYELDAALLACFQDEEMYSYPEVLDALDAGGEE